MDDDFLRPVIDFSSLSSTTEVQVHADIRRRKLESDSGVAAALCGGYASLVVRPSRWLVGLGLVPGERVVWNLGRLRLAYPVLHAIADPVWYGLQFFWNIL